LTKVISLELARPEYQFRNAEVRDVEIQLNIVLQ